MWPQAEWPPPHELAGPQVTLTQFVSDDAPELFAALDHDACWDHVAGRPSNPEEYAATLAQAPQAGRWPWVVRQDGQVVGTLGVIGPTRMAYDRVIPIVDITARLLSNALSSKH